MDASPTPPANAVAEGSAPNNVALYGGTFDPVHHGHLLIARAVLEGATAPNSGEPLDAVWFTPAGWSPFKAKDAANDGELRLAMLQAAIAGEPGFATCDVELQRDGKSFSLDTLWTLSERHPRTRFGWIIGGDNLAGLPDWHGAAELVAAFPIYTAGRAGSDLSAGLRTIRDRLGPAAAEAIEAGFVETPRIDISSTEIRDRLAAGRSVRYLLPDAVIERIEAEELYR